MVTWIIPSKIRFARSLPIRDMKGKKTKTVIVNMKSLLSLNLNNGSASSRLRTAHPSIYHRSIRISMICSKEHIRLSIPPILFNSSLSVQAAAIT